MCPEKFQRINIPELDELLGEFFPVLDKGFVRLIDYMGGDSSIVRAARVSYGKGTKTIRDDRSLIRYLFRHEHTSPFEFPNITFHIKLPIFVMRQLVRHRTASLNEISLRYSEAENDFFLINPENWRLQSNTNKQGSSSECLAFNQGVTYTNEQKQIHEKLYNEYQGRIKNNISKELARVDLPVSLYTQIYWKMDLKNLLHFLKLRMDSHAQYEIREYANIIGNTFVKKWCPLTWEAFQDFTLESIKFGKKEINILKTYFINLQIKDKEKLNLFLHTSELKGGELEEFINKLERLNIIS